MSKGGTGFGAGSADVALGVGGGGGLSIHAENAPTFSAALNPALKRFSQGSCGSFCLRGAICLSVRAGTDWAGGACITRGGDREVDSLTCSSSQGRPCCSDQVRKKLLDFRYVMLSSMALAIHKLPLLTRSDCAASTRPLRNESVQNALACARSAQPRHVFRQRRPGRGLRREARAH